MRRIVAPCALVLLGVLCGVIAWGYVPRVRRLSDQPSTAPAPMAPAFSERVPVALNRGPEVLDGFRGEVHPILHSHTEMEVTATWNFNAEGTILPTPKGWRPRIAKKNRTYTERDFSCFLPATERGAVGQLWALDLDKVAEFLKQFHPAPSMHLLAKGRRAGPDGGFAVLRAVSPSHWDIVFRVHAEFELEPATEAWYAPACFLGRLVLNRDAGTVEYFWLGLPTDRTYNVSLAVSNGQSQRYEIIAVECMELMGGNPRTVDAIRWVDQIETVEAYDRLAKVFFKFKEIDWVAFDRAQATARVRKKPIIAVVALGALDDQSC